MTFGANADNLSYLIISVFAVIPALIVLTLLGRLLGWIFRIKSGAFAPLFTTVVVVGTLLGGSFYLDLRGEPLTGLIIKKSETIKYREQGDWEFQREIHVEYTLPGQSPTNARLSPPAPIFDQLHEGDAVQLRVLNFGEWPSLVRLASQSTLTWLPWGWIGGVGAVLLILYGLWKLSDTRVGCLPGVLFVCALATLPFLNKWWQWQQSLDASRWPLRASVTIEDVRRITWLDPLPDQNGSEGEWETGFDVPQPYDIVSLRFVPEGYSDAVLAVTAVDADQPTVRPGMPVIITYSLDDPRTVQIVNASHRHLWRNPLGWIQDQAIGIAIAFALTLALGWAGQLLRRWWRQRLALLAEKRPDIYAQIDRRP